MTPDLLSGDMWDVLGQTIQWFTAHKEVLFQMRMLSANPKVGDVYGFAAWSETEGMANLRNPNATAGEFTVQIPGTFKNTVWAEIIYPYLKRLPGILHGGESLTVFLSIFRMTLRI